MAPGFVRTLFKESALKRRKKLSSLWAEHDTVHLHMRRAQALPGKKQIWIASVVDLSEQSFKAVQLIKWPNLRNSSF